MITDELLIKKEFYNKNINKIDSQILEKLNTNFDINFTYHSTTIEGNTLSLIETKTIIEDNISIGGKKLREIYEVINHNNAFKYIKNCIKNNDNLDENKIKDIHEILTDNIIQGGIYRNTDVKITGASHTPPTPNEMYKQLRFFYEDLKQNKKLLDPISLAAWTHAEFVRIHPFIDGNGRTSRLIMNFQLMNNDLPPIIIPVEKRLEYYNVLEEYAITGNLLPFEKLIYDLIIERLDELINIINQQNK